MPFRLLARPHNPSEEYPADAGPEDTVTEETRAPVSDFDRAHISRVTDQPSDVRSQNGPEFPETKQTFPRVRPGSRAMLQNW